MGFFDKAKSAVSSVGNKIATTASSVGNPVGKAIVGNKKDAGALGVGQFKATEHPIDWSAFYGDEAGEARRKSFEEQLAAATGRTGPQEFRTGQINLANDLAARARGEGPSIADETFKQTTDRNIAGAMALMNSGNMNPSAVARTTGNQLASINQAAAGDAAIARLKEAESARSALGNLLAQGRGADNELTGLNDRMALGFNELLARSESEAAQRRIAGQELGVNQAMGASGINQKAYDDASKRRGDFVSKLAQGMAPKENGGGGMFSTLFGGGGAAGGAAGGAGAAALSDEDKKENIKPADEGLQAFMDALSAHTFNYKDEKNGEGKRVGVMAQDVEKTPVGETIVKESKDGKKLDFANALGAMLASSAVLNKRINSLEKKVG